MPQTLIGVAISLAVSVALSLVTSLLFPPPRRQQQAQLSAIPKPQDGKFNLKQNVPSLPIVLGRVKKGGDYVFLEERNGRAEHVIVVAGHRIQGIVTYYLHDEAVTLNGAGGVTDPTHFQTNVELHARLGLDAETAWSHIVSTFPEIWTNDHRGDGLAQISMGVNTVDEEHYLDTFPQQMPVPTIVLDGALLYDPRNGTHDPGDDNTWSFSRNIALMRLWHLTHPSGGKLSLSDMYLPDWIAAANVCDEQVLNRAGQQESRYHGGLWYRCENDPVDIGRRLDEAAELVLYERPDGLIGVHAGRFVEPDIRITEDDIIAISVDVNRRAATTVLAVRGRFTDTGNVYNETDAAIWGNPYISDDNTQRTQTVDNQAVQSHNHIQRLQKLKMTRANAARVSVMVAYDFTGPISDITYRRFVRLHFPRRGLYEAVVEIIGRPKLSLADLTYTFDGLVVADDLYAFDAVEEEGIPGGGAGEIASSGVPVPTGCAIAIEQVVLAGGNTAARARATWTHVSDALVYELEWQRSDESEAPQFVKSRAGRDQVRTNYLVDGVEYRFRLRAWSNGGTSAWTSYITATATANPTPPSPPTAFTSTTNGTSVSLQWFWPNDPTAHHTELLRSPTNDINTAITIYVNYDGPGAVVGHEDAGLSQACRTTGGCAR